LSASTGARGGGVTDETAALQSVISAAAISNRVLLINAGNYKVTSTLKVPGNAKIVDESSSVIIGNGAYFSNMGI
jgi:glucan 1,3-beta-glucosidase